MKYYWVGRDVQPSPDRRDAYKKMIIQIGINVNWKRRDLLTYDKQYGYPKTETVTYQRLYRRHLDILLFREDHNVIRINISHNIEYFLEF